jgi:hypothetical protein
VSDVEVLVGPRVLGGRPGLALPQLSAALQLSEDLLELELESRIARDQLGALAGMCPNPVWSSAAKGVAVISGLLGGMALDNRGHAGEHVRAGLVAARKATAFWLQRCHQGLPGDNFSKSTGAGWATVDEGSIKYDGS